MTHLRKKRFKLLTNRVLVVGTTPDYIDWIRNHYPNRALFLIDHDGGQKSRARNPFPNESIYCNLSDYHETILVLQRHLADNGFRIDGIACFDCESMELAAVLAERFELPYPSVQAVRNCRDKFLSKTRWHENQLNTPLVRRIRSASEAVGFFLELGDTCVIKPSSGSGSELVFLCNSAQECEQGFLNVLHGLQNRRGNRLYKSFPNDVPSIIIEEFIGGNEYSCDFLVENGRVEIIRLTHKVLSSEGAFGTTKGYLLTRAFPDEIDKKEFLETLYHSAAVLGIRRAICMLDFRVFEGRICLIELAPRPGGDCLPSLLRCCCDLDILKILLDFSQQRSFTIPKLPKSSYVGLPLYAPKNGFLKRINTLQLQEDDKVAEIHLSRHPGHMIKLPPEDYDSWHLGHIIAGVDSDTDLEQQCNTLLGKVMVEVW